MERKVITPRKDWERKVEEVGLTFHSTDAPYWNEGACYAFSADEVDVIDEATEQLHAMCLAAVEHVIMNNRFAEMKIPAAAIPLIKWSWAMEKERTIYGRFDLVYDGHNPPKMLEYNADTPTSLLEGSVVQWYWLQDKFPKADQFNSLHEKLVERWKSLAHQFSLGPLYFAHTFDEENTEDTMTITYLRDTAEEAGIKTEDIVVDDIGWREDIRRFVDIDGNEIKSLFKLYPWEWIVAEEYGAKALELYRQMIWLEPIWKMILSNKAILAILWELFPESPYLLPAFLDGPRDMAEYVKKPIFSREGANVSIHRNGTVKETPGNYGEEGYVWQQFCQLPDFDGGQPIIGSWIIGEQTAGMGIRETRSDITDNRSTFVPHYFE